jgi:hypothetical protein
MNIFRATRESKSDVKSAKWVRNCGEYEEESGGIKFEQVGIHRYDYKRKT